MYDLRSLIPLRLPATFLVGDGSCVDSTTNMNKNKNKCYLLLESRSVIDKELTGALSSPTILVNKGSDDTTKVYSSISK